DECLKRKRTKIDLQLDFTRWFAEILIYLLNENEIFFGITAKLEALIPRVFDSNMFKRINMA
ncbi:unnamed protein product, partial [Musa acuminata subsp. burmannicoides]